MLITFELEHKRLYLYAYIHTDVFFFRRIFFLCQAFLSLGLHLLIWFFFFACASSDYTKNSYFSFSSRLDVFVLLLALVALFTQPFFLVSSSQEENPAPASSTYLLLLFVATFGNLILKFWKYAKKSELFSP